MFEREPVRMQKLICSFKCGLPNEIEFAMQVATLLANTDNFSWSEDYPLVEAICSSLFVFTCVCDEATVCHCYPRFWHKILNTNNKYLQAAATPPEQPFISFQNLTDHEPKDQDKIYKRIKMAAELIKQFSLTIGGEKSDQNIRRRKKKASPPLLRFVTLLLHCSDATLYFIGLDILSNTASKLSKLDDELVRLFQERCLDLACTTDGDIFVVSRSIEVVSKTKMSTDMIKLMMEKNFIARIEQYLTSSHNVILFLSALECFHKISLSQPHLLRAAKYSLKILMHLLDCDDSEYFSPTALKRINPPEPHHYNNNNHHHHQLEPMKKTINICHSALPRPLTQPLTPQYLCKWDSCVEKFAKAEQVKTHVFEVHIGPLPADTISSCLWSGPNGSGPGCLTKRPKFSLLTHLNDYHCSQVAFEKQIKPAEHPGYAPNAALMAIKRHAHIESNVRPSNQTPLSVSVRLTAALILRNLASDSEIKHTLKKYEPLLSEICIKGRDESKIIAECLSLL